MPTQDPQGNHQRSALPAAADAAPNRQARRSARRVAARRAAPARRRPRLSRLLAWLLSALLGSLGPAYAQLTVNTLPQGGRIVVGSGQLLQGANTLVISQSTARLGLDWQSFSIGANALVEFQQPDRGSVALNRVVGNDPSEIYGRLKANGQVFLVNPNGILFARGAKVDVGGLVASTLDLSQQDFSDGHYLFGTTARGGRVVNQGEVRASAGGYIALLGRDVDNQGSLQVDAGSVVLASGRAATVSISGNGLISAVVTPGDSGSVLNSGSISADGGSVTLTATSAEGLAASLVNNSGIVRANTLVERGGEIWITGDNVSNSGSLQARADGVGDGGRIMLLADMKRGTAQVDGSLDASAAQGNGGFVETSGAQVQVADTARVSTQAAPGRGGTWLIDPNDFTVAASGGNMTGAALSGNMALNGAVTISTATQGTPGGNGDIFINDTASWAAGLLTLVAERNIAINSPLNGAGIALQYGQASTAGTGASYSINAPVTLLAGNSSFSTKQGSTGSTVTYTLINSVAGLAAVDGNATALAGNYALATSLDLTGVSFSPIGNEATTGVSTTNSFGGRFEGLGQTITGLSYSPTGSSSAGGLFATTNNATLSNLKLTGFSLNGGFATGTLAGLANNTAIRNVSATASSVQSGVNAYLGGLVGRATGTSSSISGSSAAVTVSTSITTSYTGGLVGDASGTISSSSASGNVTGGARVGGLVGSFLGSSLTDVSASGDVTSTTTSADVGGLVGYAQSNGGTLTNSFATGNVSAAANADSVGGLVGEFLMTGGISGVTAGSTNSTVSGGTATGGVIGYTTNGAATSFTTVTNGVQFAFRGASVSGNGWVGGLVGQSFGAATFSGVSNSAAVSTSRASAGGAGGIAGYVAGAVTNASSTGNVSATGSATGSVYMGGLVGQATGSAYTISGSTASGSVSGNGAAGTSYGGGLVGVINPGGSVNISVSNSSASGAVSGFTNGAGGLVAYLDGGGSVSNSFALGNVTAIGSSGDVGGLLGYAATSGSLTNSYARGSVSAPLNADSVGGLVGQFQMTGGISKVSAGDTNSTVSGGNYTGGVLGWTNNSSTTSFTHNAADTTLAQFDFLGSSVSGNAWVGGLVGQSTGTATFSGVVAHANVSGNRSSSAGIGGMAGSVAGAVSNASASGSVGITQGSTGTGIAYMGGLIGQAAGGSNYSISNSTATGTVTGNYTSTSGGGYAGGLVGQVNVSTNAVNVTGSTASGNVSGTSTAGGLVGYADGTGSITASTATGSVSGTNNNTGSVGGLVGEFRMSGGMSDVHAAGAVSTGYHVGGLAGYTNTTGTIGGGSAASTVTSASVTGGVNVGGVIGYAQGTGTITNFTTSMAVTGGSVTNPQAVGGIVGRAVGLVSNSTSSSSVSGNANTNVGGLVGWSEGGGVSNSSASGTVSQTGTNASVGGLVGYLNGATGISNSSASGNVSSTSTNTNVGGLVGAFQGTGGSISGSSATGAVNGGQYVGGLVGYFNPAGTSAGNISNSFATGDVATTQTGGDVGGLVGYAATAGALTNSYARGNVTAAAAADSVGGLVGQFQMTGGISKVSAGNTNTTVSGGNYTGGVLGWTNNGSTTSFAHNAADTTLAQFDFLGSGVSGNTWVGGLVGQSTGTATFSGVVAHAAVTTNRSTTAGAGGMAGYVAGAVSNASASGSVGITQGSTGTGTVYLGGLIGQAGGGSNYGVSNSSASGAVTGNYSSTSGGGYAGGLIGQVNVGSNAVNVSGSTASGNVSGTSTAGGLVGYADGAGSITASTATGTVSGTNNNTGSVGGLVGEFRMSGGMSDVHAGGAVSTGYNVGGLAGYTNTAGTIGGGNAASTVTASSVSGGANVGGVIGYAQGSGGITNFTTSMAVTGGSVTNPQTVGGIVGRSVGLVSNSTSSSNVSGNANTDIGGLVGWSEGGGVQDSSASGTVTQTGNNAGVGGLVGYLNGSGSILRSSATGAVSSTGTDPWVGGLVGGFQGSGSITSSSATGNVSGGNVVGGLVGYFSTGTGIASSTASGNVTPAGTSPNAGGLAGQVSGSGSISNSGATGTVFTSATSGNVGGAIGLYQLTGSLSGLSAAGNVSGGATAGGVIGYFNVSNVALGAGSIIGVLPTTGQRTVSATTWAGGLVGYSDSSAAVSGLSFTGSVSATGSSGAAGGLFGRTNGAVNNSSSAGSVSGPGHAGGLVGQANGGGGFSGDTSSAAVTNPGTGGYVGGLVGYFNNSGGLTGSSNVTTATGNVSGGNRTGGLVGYYAGGGSAANVSASGSVAGDAYVGGLIGDFVSSGDLTNAMATGNVTARDIAGGLVGSFYNAGNASLLQATGNVTSTAGYAGGLFALWQYSGTLTDSLARGNVAGFHHAGGAIGYTNSNGAANNLRAYGSVQANNPGSTTYVGGLIGEANYTTVTQSQASGSVSAVSGGHVYAGGLIGYYYNSNTGGSLDNSSATGRVQVDAASTYSGGLVGYMGYGALSQVGASGNVTVVDSRNSSGTSQTVGGLVGYMSSPSGISDATAQGNVSGNYMVGGLVGNFSTTSTLSNVSASGNVSGGSYAGGLVGYAPSGAVQTATASGNVTPGSNASYAGGLIGFAGLPNGQSIADAHATGSVASGASYAGGLIGYLNDTNTTGQGPAVANSSASGSVSATYAAGGLVGYWNWGAGSSANRAVRSLQDSLASGNVTGGVYSGGAAGYFASYGGILRVAATGNVTTLGYGTSDYYAGGLVGYFQNYGTLSTAATGQISGSYATGSVTANFNSPYAFTNAYLGGLVGYAGSPSTTFANIVDSYATGAVNQTGNTGRLRSGALLGYSNGSLANVYATGLVTATTPGTSSRAGGLVAEAASGTTATASFWATDSTGRATSALGTGVTLADLKTAGTFTGWDLSTTGGSNAVWRLYEGMSTPLLRSFLTPLALSLANVNKVYDGTASLGSGAITIGNTGVLHPERILVSATAVDAGTYALSAANLYSVQNGYDLTLTGQANLTIAPRPLTFAGLVADKVYDGTRSATLLSSPQLGGLVAGEDLLFQPGSGFSALFDTKTAGAAKTVTLSGTFTLQDGTHGKASNYLAPSVLSTTAAITPATVSAGSFSAVNRAYDGTTTVQVVATSGTVTGVIAGDQVSVDISGASSGTMADKNVGTGKAVTINGVALTGADAANYVVGGAGTATVDITPRVITVNGLQASDRDYNRGTSVSVNASSALLSGAISGDSVQLISTSLSGQTADKNVGNAKPVTVSGLGLRGLDAYNYTVQQGTVTVNISPYSLTLYLSRTSTTDRLYDGTANASTTFPVYWYSGDDIVVSATSIGYSDKNVAYTTGGAVTSKTITASGLSISGADAGNYTLVNTTATTTGTIQPRALTVSGVSAVDHVYDGTRNVAVNIAGATVDTSNLVAGDSVSVATPSSGTVTGQTADKNVGTNKAVTVPGLTLTGSDAGNYTITGSGSGVTVNITPKPLTAVYAGVDKVYDSGTSAAVQVTSADILSGDQIGFYADRNYCTGCWTVFTDRNAGTGKTINITYNGLYGSDAANYSLVNTTGTTTANITPKPVTLRFTATFAVYDGTTNATVGLNLSSSGIYSVDQITTTQTAQFTDSKNVGTNKPIAVSNIVATGTGAANYSFSNTTATTTGNLTAKPVTVSGITGVDRAYDGTTTVAVVAGTVGSAGFVAGDTVSVTLPTGGITSGTIANKNVGSNKPVTVTGLGLAGSDAANYSIDSAASGITVNITAAGLTPTFVGVDRVYNGGVAAQVTSTTAGILAGDTVTFSQQAVYTGQGAKDAGTGKTISVTNIVLGGASAANYTLLTTTASTTGSILPKPVSVSFVGGSRVYNGLADVTASVVGTSLQFVSGDDVSTTQTALFSGDGSVGSNKAVSISNIGLAGAQAANYSLLTTTATTTASITPRPLAVSGITATNRVYDGTTTVAVDVSHASVDTTTAVSGDDVSAVLPSGGISTGTMADRNAGNAKAVNITGITLTGAQASNYVLVGASGLTVNIAPKPVTAQYSVAGKVYDANADATVSGTSTDFLGVDSGLVAVVAQGSFTAGKNVGTGKAVAITGGFLQGSARDNYLLLNASGSGTADITPRSLTVNYTGGSRVYDGGVSAPVSGSISGRLSNDVVGVAQTAVFTGTGARNVGTGKAITVSGVFLTGNDAGNYTVGSVTGTPTGTITPKPITVSGLNSVTAVNRTYDGSTQVDVSVPSGVTLTPVSSDIVSGDQVSISVPGSGLTTGTMADKNAGNGKLVSVTGLTLSGADAGNYLIAGTAGITVNIAPLAIVAAWAGVNRVYDGTLSATATGTSSGVLAGDSLTIRGFGVFTDNKNVGTAKPVSITSGTLSGADAGNYSLSNPTGSTTADVTPRAVTPSFTGGSRVYDGGTAAPVTDTTSGFVSGDQVGLTETAVFTGAGAKNVGTSKPIQVSGITLTGADAGNYSLLAGTATTSGSITPKPLTLQGLSGLTAQNRFYDGTRTVQITVSGSGSIAVDPADLIAGDVVGVTPLSGSSTTGTVANKNVGVAKAVTVTGLTLTGADAANYSIAATQGLTVNITPLDLTATWLAASRVYDGSTVASISGTSSAVIAGDNVVFGASGSFTDGKNVGTAKPVAITAGRITGSDAANYTLLNTTGSATADVTPRSATATYVGGSKVYDGTLNAAVSGTLANLVLGDSVTLTQTAVFTGDKNVGTGKAVSITGITLSGADAANYSLTAGTASTTGSITPRPLHLVGLTGVTADSREYDGTQTVVVHVASTGTVTADPADLIAGDVVNVVAPPTGTTTGTLATKNIGLGLAVAVTGLGLTGADAGNYSVTGTSGVTVDITPRHLTAVYSGVNRVYDATAAATVTASAARLISGDAATLSASGQFTDGKNVGTAKPIAVTAGTLTGADAGNYVLDNPTGSTSADVTPKLLTAGYVGGSRVYDGTAAAPVTGTLSGVLSGDTVAASQTAVFSGGSAAKNVGTAKQVVVSGITLSGADAGNYGLVSTTATTTGSITPRPLTVSGLSGITAVDRVYDGSTTVALNVPGSLGSANGDALSGDDVQVVISGGGIGAGTMLTKDAGQAKAVVLSGLSLSGVDAGNYFVAGTTGLTVNIAPKALNPVFSVSSKVYDGTAAATVLGGSGDIVSGDSVSIAGTGQYTGSGAKNVGTAKAISITGVTLTGADAANYALTATSGSATGDITARLLTASYSGGTKVYDGTDAASVTRSVTGLVAGDAVSITESAVFTGAGAKNVGTGKAISVSGITLSGADAANYSLLAGTVSTTGSITPRPLTVSGISGITVQDRMYDGTTAVAVNLPSSISGLSGDVIAGDNVTVIVGSGGLTGGSMLDKNVGTAKPVVLQGLALSGADAANYTIAGTLGLTVNITPRPLAITGVTAVDRVYDGSTTVAINAAGGTLSGALAGDDVRLPSSGVTASMADKNVGTGKAVTVSGLTLAGADIGNYSVSGGTGLTVNITPRMLTATASVANKVYDGTTGATVTLADDRVAGDQLSLSANASFASSHAGNGITVAVSSVQLAGSDAANYQWAGGSFNTSANITPRPATVTASNQSKVYGDTLAAASSLFTVGSGDLVAGETIGSVTLSSAGAAATAHAAGSPYALTASAATGGSFDPSNYALTYVSGLLTVTPRPVTVSVAGQQLSAGVDEAGRPVTWPTSFNVTASQGGLVGSDAIGQVAVSVVGQTGTAARVGQYELRPSGGSFTSGSASDYTLSYQSGALLVLPQATGLVLAVQLDPAELDRAERELDRLSGSLARQRAVELLGRLRSVPAGGTPELSAGDLALLLAAQERRVNPQDLVKLPLYSLDPELRRQMQQPVERTTP